MTMRGKKLNFQGCGSQYLELIADSVEAIYHDSGMADVGQIKVTTFINELKQELRKRGENED